MTSLLRGRYEPVEQIGAGGQGVVLKALDHQHARHVAIKTRRAASDDDRAAVLREARVLLDLRPHAGLPLVREDFFDGGEYHLVMDWIDGVNLARILASEGTPGLDLDRVLSWITQVADALDHLHAHDPPVVHGDVKPANVVLASDGRAVLVDFGISLPGARSAYGGTTGYLAPDRVAQPSSDVFSLAVTAFVLLTGALPEPGMQVPLDPFVTAGLAAGMALDPGARPRSAAALVSSLVPPATRHNLPAARTSFVARDRELAELGETLAAARLVTVAGPGGGGKTRLAVEAATLQLRTYTDGVWMAPLAGVEDGSIVADIVAATVDPSGSADTATDAIGDGHVLLVLDNCEHLLDDVSALAETLLAACANLTILATSREPLGVLGEAVFALAPLDRSGATRLFAERGRAARPSFAVDESTADAVARLCERLGGLPLAIELAAASLWDTDVSALAGRIAVLEASARTVDPRHRSLRAALDWSFERLPGPERSLFARLGCFAGAFLDEDARAISSVGDLDRLERSSLVARDGDRYRMLTPVREYASEQLHATGDQEAVRARHAAHFEEVVRDWGPKLAFPERADALRRLDPAVDDLRAAMTFALSGRGDPVVGLRIASNGWRYWTGRGLISEGRRWIARGLEAASAASDRLRASATAAAGLLAERQTDYADAAAMLGDALEQWRAIGDESWISAILNNLGNVAYVERRLTDAESLYGEAAEAARRAGNPRREIEALGNIGSVRLAANDLDRATETFEAVLDAARRIGKTDAVVVTLNNLAVIASERGELGEMASRLSEAESAARELDGPAEIATTLTNRGLLESLRGDLDAAESLYREALAIQLEIGHRHLANSLEGLAEIALRRGRAEEAARCLCAAAVYRERHRTPVAEFDAHAAAELTARVRDAAGAGAFARAQQWAESMTAERLAAELLAASG